MTQHARYRRHNDHTHSRGTYHKKDGTAVRTILKREAEQEIIESMQTDTDTVTESVVYDHFAVTLVGRRVDTAQWEAVDRAFDECDLRNRVEQAVRQVIRAHTDLDHVNVQVQEAVPNLRTPYPPTPPTD